MVCINRRLIGIWSKLYEQDDTGPLSSRTVYDDAQTEYFEYDGSDIDVELLFHRNSPLRPGPRPLAQRRSGRL